MTTFLSPALAEAAPEPLFGNQWLALLAILISIVALLVAIAAMGRRLAATHPDEPAPIPAPAPAVAAVPQPKTEISQGPTAELFAVIAAAVAVTLGPKARISAINPLSNEPSSGSDRLQWSMEGRRQIYSSHKVR